MPFAILLAARGTRGQFTQSGSVDVARKRQQQAALFSIPAMAALLLALQGCAAFLHFPQNVPAFNDDFRLFYGEQYRPLEWQAFTSMPSFGDITVQLPAGMSLGQHSPGSPPVKLLYAKNRAAGLMGTQWRQLHVYGVPDSKTMRFPVPRLDGYHPKTLVFWVRDASADSSASSMRVLFRLAETEVIDPDDPDRHVAFWRDHNDQCFARGRVQTIESTLDKDDSYPLQFDSTLRGLCVFHPTSGDGVVAIDTPSWHLRSNVRVNLPKHYQNPRYRSQWQPYPQQENAQ